MAVDCHQHITSVVAMFLLSSCSNNSVVDPPDDCALLRCSKAKLFKMLYEGSFLITPTVMTHPA